MIGARPGGKVIAISLHLLVMPASRTRPARDAVDQSAPLQKPKYAGFRDEILALIGEAHGNLARAQLRRFQRQFDDLGLDRVGDFIPNAVRL